eukprot:3505825-Amphidinium_carterae.1
MKDLRACARGALGKGASLRRLVAREFIWQRRTAAGKITGPFLRFPGKGPSDVAKAVVPFAV